MEVDMREVITSRQNPRIKATCALNDKKGRRESRRFRFDGIKLFLEAQGRARISCVLVRYPMTDAAEKCIFEALSRGTLSEDAVVYVSDTVFDKLTDETSPEGIVTVAEYMDELHKTVSTEDVASLDLDAESLLLVESLRDVGNLGTVMRSCAALGIDRLVLTDDCAKIYSPKTIRAAMGAAFRMSTLTVKGSELAEFIGLLRESGRRVYATALYEDSKTLGDIELRACDCFVIGNEGHGLSDSAVRACDASVIIPMREDAESLNAAAAAAICIWETVRAEAL